MIGWVGDVEQATVHNETFRTVLYTGEHLQLTVMSLQPGDEIGLEAHRTLDQFIRVEMGEARIELGETAERVDESHVLFEDWAVVIPAGIWHNVINAGSGALRLYSLYAPPEHPPNTVHATKAEADTAEHDH